MLVGRTTYDAVKQRQKSTGELSPKRIPLSSEFMSSKNSLNNIERPLKSNQNDLSFKGLSFKGENKPKKKDDKMKPLLATFGVLAATGLALRFAPRYKEAGNFKVTEFLEFAQKHMGVIKKDAKNPDAIVNSSIAEELFESVRDSELTKNLIKVDGDNVTFYKKTIPQLIWDGLIYPFKILPADILNGGVELIGKIKPFKGWAEKTLQKPMFKNIRQRSKIDAKVNSLRGLFKTASDLNGKTEAEISSAMFQRSVKMFDPGTGNYDTKHERSLNRLVSGLPPALFLANDAYNLSRMMDDDGKAATEEQKVRFKQEMARIGFNAYITLVTLGALNKYINNSKMGIMLMTGLTTLTTEAFSRVINGKHITRLTPEEARRENEKNQAPEAQIKPDLSFKASEKPKEDKEKQQKPLLTFNSAMKAVGLIIAGGYAAKGLRKISAVDNAWKNFSGYFKNLYKDATQIKDYRIPQEKLNEITKVLDENGFTKLAEKYRNVAKTAVNPDGTISLGVKDKKTKPLVDFFLAPFRFIWKYGSLPYKFVDDAVQSFGKKAPKAARKKVEDISALAKSIDNIGREATKKNYTPEQFQSYVKDNILKAFNVDTMSNVSNSELSNLAKTAALAATIWFLMTDNYNMVMLKSNGNDVEGAKTKFTERFVQEGSRLFYQTLLIDLFNSTFKSQYNKSLFGMSWITLTNTTMGEWLTRKSVGVPVGTHTRDQLIELENKQENATGFERKYYDFMKRLTGKRSIKTYEVDKKEQPVTAQAQEINFTNKSSLNKIIKG
ncbi:TPA: hypothetical protein CPT81_01015 [Candidatus Gastranaerophilales bacterium HUM_20]|nr:unknown [Clostridium sp. CAG:729]DAB24606.1 MAG TPA: hypothetical protein CPT81_01015 [Candidatus Gastranaerophilales bacterium HUM_20]